MMTKIFRRFALFSLAAAACTASPEHVAPRDDPQASAEADPFSGPGMEAELGLQTEQDGLLVSSAKISIEADPEDQQRVQDARTSTCKQVTEPNAAPMPEPKLARGLVEPRFRVEEDQDALARRLATDPQDPDASEIEFARDEVIDAQLRYRRQAEVLDRRFEGSDEEFAQARAELKESLLGEL